MDNKLLGTILETVNLKLSFQEANALLAESLDVLPFDIGIKSYDYSDGLSGMWQFNLVRSDRSNGIIFHVSSGIGKRKTALEIHRQAAQAKGLLLHQEGMLR